MKLTRTQKRMVDRALKKGRDKFTALGIIGKPILNVMNPKLLDEKYAIVQAIQRLSGDDNVLLLPFEGAMCDACIMAWSIVHTMEGLDPDYQPFIDPYILTALMLRNRQGDVGDIGYMEPQLTATNGEYYVERPLFTAGVVLGFTTGGVTGRSLRDALSQIPDIPIEAYTKLITELYGDSALDAVVTKNAVRRFATWLWYLTHYEQGKHKIPIKAVATPTQILTVLEYGMVFAGAVLLESFQKAAEQKPTVQRIPLFTRSRSRREEELEAEIERLRKLNNEIEAEVRQPLQHIIDQQDIEIESLKSKLAQLEVSAVDENDVPNDVELLQLPANGILVVGGHDRLQQRLQGQFPNWTYVGPGDLSTDLGTPDMAFCLTAYLSHAMWERVDKFVPKENIIRIHNITNVHKLVRAMRYAYTENVKRGKHDEV